MSSGTDGSTIDLINAREGSKRSPRPLSLARPDLPEAKASEEERPDSSGLTGLIVPGDPAASLVTMFRTLRILMVTFFMLLRRVLPLVDTGSVEFTSSCMRNIENQSEMTSNTSAAPKPNSFIVSVNHERKSERASDRVRELPLISLTDHALRSALHQHHHPHPISAPCVASPFR